MCLKNVYHLTTNDNLARSANLPEKLYFANVFSLLFISLMVDILDLVSQNLMDQSSPQCQDW